MIDIGGVVNGVLEGLLHIILDFVLFIVNLLLLPIDAVLSNLVPDYVELTTYINDFLTLASQYIGYCLDSVGFYSSTVVLLVAFLTFKLTVPLQLWIGKLAIRWYNAMKT